MLSGDSKPDEVYLSLLRQIEEFSQVFTDSDSRAVLTEASAAVIGTQHYRAMKALKSLFPREDRLIAIGAS